MPQTERTTAEVNELLKDNTSEDISPQDMRDVVASIFGGYAGLGFAGAASGSLAVDVTPAVITQYDEVISQSIDVNLEGCAANQSTGIITIGQAGIYQINFFCSFDLTQNNRLVSFQLFVNGGSDEPGLERFVSNGADVGEVAASGPAVLADGAVLDIRASIDTGTAGMIFSSLGFSVFRVG